MKAITFSEEKRDLLACDLLRDAIVFEKVSKAMDQMQKVFDPQADYWEPSYQAGGAWGVLPLFGFTIDPSFEQEKLELPLKEDLSKIFRSVITEEEAKPEEQQRTANKLAEHILFEWKRYLRGIEIPLLQVG